MRTGLLWAVLLLALPLSSEGRADTRTKLALVIGVSDYDGRAGIDASDAGVATATATGHVNDLANARGDAQSVAETLRGIGYSVQLVLDPDREAMLAAVAAFAARSQAAPANHHAVVYFAGHGVLVKDAYLIPAGARIDAAGRTGRERLPESILADVAMTVWDLVRPLERRRRNGLLLIVVDACRNNPWRFTFGEGATRQQQIANMTQQLTEQMATFDSMYGFSKSAVVAYSTDPNKVAEDGDGQSSPYADAFKRRVAMPGTTVGVMLDTVRADVVRETQGRQSPTTNENEVGRRQCMVSCPRRRAAR